MYGDRGKCVINVEGEYEREGCVEIKGMCNGSGGRIGKKGEMEDMVEIWTKGE